MEITPIIIDSLNALFILIRVWSATKLIKKDIFAPAYAQPFHTKRNRPSAIAYKRRQPYWLLNWDFAECG